MTSPSGCPPHSVKEPLKCASPAAPRTFGTTIRGRQGKKEGELLGKMREMDGREEVRTEWQGGILVEIGRGSD